MAVYKSSAKEPGDGAGDALARLPAARPSALLAPRSAIYPDALPRLQALAGNKAVAQLVADNQGQSLSRDTSLPITPPSLLLALFIGGAAQMRLANSPYRGKYKLKNSKIYEYLNCSEAEDRITADAEAGNHHGETTWQLKEHRTKMVIENIGSSYQATVKVTRKIDIGDCRVRLPQYGWDNMTDIERSIVRGLEAAIQLHEEGHIDVAVKFAEEEPKDIIVMGEGPTKKAAIRDLNETLVVQYNSAANRLQARSDAYDVATQHGRKQSAVGGIDTDFLRCDRSHP